MSRKSKKNVRSAGSSDVDLSTLNKDVDTITTCPVCTESYRDPRTLNCGHHFCLPCLEKIASGHPDGHVICPTCRHLTDVTDVNELNRYKYSEFQAKAKDFIAIQPPNIEKSCVYCKTNTPATKSCLDCSISFCKKCAAKHQTAIKVLNHRVVPISSNVFCKEHSDWFIQCICETCDVTCCHLCMNDHKDHKLSDLRIKAKEAREAFAQEAANLDCQIDEEVYQRIDKLKKEHKKMREDFKGSIVKIRNHLQSLLKTVDQIETKLEECMKAEAKKIDILEFDAKEFMKTKKELKKHICQLSNEVSDPDVVFKRQELPSYASSALIDSLKTSVEKQGVEYIDLSILKSFEHKLLSCTLMIDDIATKPFCLSRLNSSYSFGNLELSSKLKFSDGLEYYQMCYWKEKDVFVIPKGKSLAVINAKSGETESSIDLGKRLTVYSLTSIAFDTKRKCLIIPTRQGSIVIAQPESEERKVIQITNSVLHGAAYYESKDLYVVSSAGDQYGGEDRIYIVDPKTKKESKSFSTNTESAGALFVGCGFDKSLCEDEVIFVSCHLGNCIEVYEIVGNLLHTYGRLFRAPSGLYLGKEFKLACNYGSYDVAEFWRDKDGDHKETIISIDMIDGLAPNSVYCNQDAREIYVCCSKKTLYVFKEKTQMLS